MRPQRLVMQAFGSYGRLTEIDFEMTNQNLFLISGDTGADSYLRGELTLSELLDDWRAQSAEFEAEVAALRLYE